jgi:hypothetical protein
MTACFPGTPSHVVSGSARGRLNVAASKTYPSWATPLKLIGEYRPTSSRMVLRTTAVGLVFAACELVVV